MTRKEESRAVFNEQAAVYDTANFSLYARESYPHVLREISGHAYHTLLDVGCGTGVMLEALLREKADARYYGLDLSDAMLAQAEQRLQGSAALTQGDAEHLPYADGQFDIVTCMTSFHHYPDPGAALREVRRVLQNGGTYILSDMWEPAPKRQAFNLLLRFHLLKGGDVHIYSQKETTALLRKAGFREVAWWRTGKHTFLCTAI